MRIDETKRAQLFEELNNLEGRSKDLAAYVESIIPIVQNEMDLGEKDLKELRLKFERYDEYLQSLRAEGNRIYAELYVTIMG